MLCREDWNGARTRMAAWWNGEDIGRAAMQIVVPRSEPVEYIEEVPMPEGWVRADQATPAHRRYYSTKSLPYKIYWARRQCADHYYFGEAVPAVATGDLAPNCLALFLGCTGVELPGTVWCKPCIEAPETAEFVFDPGNFYFRFCLNAYEQAGPLATGKFLQQFPDLIEGLDTLAAMRGSETMLQDLLDRPHWVKDSLRRITDLYFRYYDVFYDLIRDDVGGSVFWAWAPGRLTKLQCDCSASISPGMFREFMVPVLKEMTERVSYSIYHWDGPCALQHHDALLEIPRLSVLQWTPGARHEGAGEGSGHRRWWPLYHKTIDAGKRIFITVGSMEELAAIKHGFGRKSHKMLISVTGLQTPAEAEQCLRFMEA